MKRNATLTSESVCNRAYLSVEGLVAPLMVPTMESVKEAVKNNATTIERTFIFMLTVTPSEVIL